jgi:hypothetical protein
VRDDALAIFLPMLITQSNAERGHSCVPFHMLCRY